MKQSYRFAILAVVGVALAGILALKYRDRARLSESPLPPPPAAVAAERRASILLFTDLSEAGTEDACAILIETVRAARERGFMVTEYDSGKAPDVRKRHRVVVEPTVIVLDASGREVARHEGEDISTIEAVRADIDRLSGGRV